MKVLKEQLEKASENIWSFIVKTFHGESINFVKYCAIRVKLESHATLSDVQESRRIVHELVTVVENETTNVQSH